MFPLARDLPQSEFRSDGGLGVARLTTFDKHGCFFLALAIGCQRSVSGDFARIAVSPCSTVSSLDWVACRDASRFGLLLLTTWLSHRRLPRRSFHRAAASRRIT